MKLLALISAAAALASAQNKQLAITIDDLPCAGGCRGIAEMQSITDRILTALKGVPAIGFVNEVNLQVHGERDVRIRLLERWLETGMMLGNHTYSHRNPGATALADYQDDIIHGEVVFKHLLAQHKIKRQLYFRHPFTRTGPTPEYRRGLEQFLEARGYQIAPFTIENGDYIWALVYRRALERKDAETAAKVRKQYLEHLGEAMAFAEKASVQVFQREIPQTLLIHANLLNAEVLPEMLALFRGRGYTIVDLERAMEDKAYQTPDPFVGNFGPSWLHRWGLSRGLKNVMKGEPEVPKWVMDLYQQASR
jgi:peptidoglycan/xylan/chitin deacetylase (PgdA/CDA1 family)